MPTQDADASTFAPLRRPVFRMLWLAWLGANVAMWMHDVACAWAMTALTGDPLMVALVQSAAALPVFLLGLPFGALADSADRRRFLMLTQLWTAAVAGALAVLSYAGALSASALLACACANGIGMAMRWPLFAAITPDLVPRADLAGALALNNIAALLARIAGPLLAGALIAGAGNAAVYLCNALLSGATVFLVLRWRPAVRSGRPAAEGLGTAMRAGLAHVLGAPLLRGVLVRVALFFFQITALMALLPLVALRLGAGEPAAYTALLVALAAGAIGVASNLAWLRRRAGPDAIVAGGTCVHAAASAGVALAPSMAHALPAMAIAGMAWIATANALTVAMQLALPDRLRARGMALYHMAVMGAGAAGAAWWGWLAAAVSVRAGILTAAVFGCAVALLARRGGTGGGLGGQAPPAPGGACDGPVVVTVEYLVDPARTRGFRAVLRPPRNDF